MSYYTDVLACEKVRNKFMWPRLSPSSCVDTGTPSAESLLFPFALLALFAVSKGKLNAPLAGHYAYSAIANVGPPVSNSANPKARP